MFTLLYDLIFVSLGGIIGASLRYLVNLFSIKFISSSLPFGTLIVNVSGSLILGFFFALTTQWIIVDPRLKLFVATGFCGAYTTFSTFTYETISLLEYGQYSLAGMNFLSNNLLSFLAAMIGIVLARVIK